MVDKKNPSPKPPAARQPSSAELVKQMKDSIKISLADAEENIIKIFDNVIQQFAAAAQQINSQQNHINSLEGFLKDNGIPLDAVIPKTPGQPAPNRETRRKISKVAEKHKKSKK